MALIFAQTALLGFQSSRFPRTLSFTLLLHRSHFRVFNLPFHIYIYIYLVHRNVKKGGCTWRPPHAKYCMTTLESVGILKSYPSMLARIKAPPEKAFFTMYGPSLVRANFPL